MPDAMRAAENENIFRRVNERLEELGGDRISFICECADLGCRDRIELTVAEYEHVRAAPSRFVVRPGHERTEVEEVLAHRGGYLVIEKTGIAGAVAAADDPRKS